MTNQITYHLPDVSEAKDGKWSHLTSVPHVECSNFGTAVLKNELYVIGGCFNQSLQEEHIHPFGFKYNPKYNKWTTLAPMCRERCRFSLTVFGRSLYAIGGCFEGDDMLNVNNNQLCEK